VSNVLLLYIHVVDAKLPAVKLDNIKEVDKPPGTEKLNVVVMLTVRMNKKNSRK